MSRRLGFVVSAALVLAPHGAQSDVFESGNGLLEGCSRDPSWCLGYIVGVADAMLANGGTFLGWRVCFPASVVQGELQDVVIKYLQTWPERRDYGASGLVAHALSEAFPCP